MTDPDSVQKADIAEETDYVKIRAIYDYLSKNVTYDYENLNKDGYDRRQTAAGAILDHTSVCEGYAAAFFRMCCAAEERNSC